MNQDSPAGDKERLFRPSLTADLSAVRKRLLWRGLLLCLLRTLAACGGYLLLLTWAERLLGMQETSALALLAVGGLCAVVFVCLAVRHALARFPTLAQMSWEVEKACPELRDAYACAVETEHLDRAPREIELVQHERLLARLDKAPLGLKRIFAKRLGWLPPACWLLVSVVLLALGCRGRVCRKGYWGLQSLLSDQAQGLVVAEVEAEYQAGSDIRVNANVRRWECEGVLEWREDGGEIQSAPMTALPDRRLALTLFEVSAPLEFRVVTPSLRTGWQRVGVYEAPEARKVEIRVEPQEYTGRPPQEFETWHDLSLVAGDRYAVRLWVNSGISASLWDEAREIGIFQPSGDGELRLEDAPAKSGRRQVIFADVAGHRHSGRSFQVEIIPDLPPVLEVKEPSAETKLHRGDDVRLKIYAADDFGLSRVWLRYTISGGEPQEMTLFASPTGTLPAKEQEINQLWKLSDMSLPDGEFISAVVLAEDNRQPTPQTTAGDLLFLTVLPREEEVEADEGNGQQEEMEVDLGPLLAEAKRLLRLGWDNLALSRNLTERNEELRRGQEEQQRDLRKLAAEVIRFGEEMRKKAPGPLPPDLTSALQQIAQYLEAAANLAERWLFQEALRPQEQALALLVRLENELLKNAMSRSQSGQSSGQQPSQGEGQEESKSPSEQQPQAQPEQDASQLREQLKQELEQVQRLAQEQNKLNSDIHGQQNLASQLAERQEQLRRETEQLASSLSRQQLANTAAHSLQQGEREMSRGTEALGQGQSGTAEAHGQRVLQQLQMAGRQLESALRQLTTAQLRNLAGQAESLARQQEAEAMKTGEMTGDSSRSDSAAARQRQKDLQSATERLEQALRQEAERLSEEYPETGKALSSALERSRQRGLQSSQQKAGNALLYRRFETASREQGKAANLLQALGQDIREGLDKMPAIDSEELQRALEQLEKWREELSQAARDRNQQRGQQRQRQVREMAAEELGDLGRALRDEGLREVSGRLARQGDFSDTEGENPQLTAELLRAASVILQRRLEALAVEEKVRFSRDKVRPPRQYRRQVEEYFRKLGGDR